MDSETGEKTNVDKETGEEPPMGRLNSETGEFELIRKRPDISIKRPFKVPTKYIQEIVDEFADKRDKTVTKKIIFTNTIPFSPIILFLLPTAFLFMPIIVIPLSIIELTLHAWAHRKNNILRSNNIYHIYYQSPLHVYVSQFCAACRYESSKEAISKLQDKWKKRFIKYGVEYVKQVV